MALSAPRKEVVAFNTIPADLLATIKEQHEVVTVDPRRRGGYRHFMHNIRDVHGLIGSSVQLGAAELDMASQLEVISSISSGIDNFDLEMVRRLVCGYFILLMY